MIKSSSVFFLSVLFLVITSFIPADHYDYDTDLLPADFHKERREALRKLLPDSSVVVFFSNPLCVRSNDVDFDFHQDVNLYYLTGLREPNSMLVLFKEKQEVDTMFTNELLVVQDRDPKAEVWTGRRLGIDGAKTKLKVNAVVTGRTFRSIRIDWKKYKRVFFFPANGGVANDPENANDLADLVRKFRSGVKNNANNDTLHLGEFMAMMRQVKLPQEMVLLRKAITISGEAHIEMMKAMTQDMTEYQVQATLEYEFRKRGAEAVGYPSICGAGENSCILHYVSNRKPMEKNNLIVIDAGAEYHGYTADITRTLPANGKYSAEQKAIYDIVLEAQEAGIKECIPGNEFRAPHKAAVRVIKKRLKELGIIQNDEDYQLYFFHGTSHYLGLDVHDAGLYGKLENGNLITVEPGIYIPEGSPCDPKWWNIGVRIEDDILITTGQPENLSGFIPKTTADIEKMMAETSYLNKEQGQK
ncbi:MAG: aminopeptidase P family protein [Bacteroidota bacterium]|nr:aminopeptidase P family protein [Bacteroidota bacterium]